VLVDNPEPLVKAGGILSSNARALAHYFDSINDCANMVGNAEHSVRISITP